MKDVVNNFARHELEELFYGEAIWNIDDLYQKVNASVKKRYDGRYVTKDFVKRFVKNQVVTQLFRPYRREGQCDRDVRRLMTHHRVFYTGVYLQFDLACMQDYTTQTNMNMNYILVGVDLGSRRLYLRYLQNKSAKSVLAKVIEIIEESNAFHKNLQEAVKTGNVNLLKTKDEALKAHVLKIENQDREDLKTGQYDIGVRVIQSDNGSEFKNSEFSKTFRGKKAEAVYGANGKITQIFSHPYKPTTQGNVERNIGSLKRKLYKFFYVHQTKGWLSMAQKYQENFNSTPHRSLNGHTPNVQALLMAMPSWKGRVMEKDGGWYEELGPREGSKYAHFENPLKARIVVRRQIESGLKPDTKRPFWSERVFNVVGKTTPNKSRRVKYKVEVSLPSEKNKQFKFYSGDELQFIECACGKPERFKLSVFEKNNPVPKLNTNDSVSERRRSPRRDIFSLNDANPVIGYNKKTDKFLFNWEPSFVHEESLKNYDKYKNMIEKKEPKGQGMYMIHWKPTYEKWESAITDPQDKAKKEFFKSLFSQARVSVAIEDPNVLFSNWVNDDIEESALLSSVQGLNDFGKRKAFMMMLEYKYPDKFKSWALRGEGVEIRFGDDNKIVEYRGLTKELVEMKYEEYFPFPVSGNLKQALRAHLHAHCVNVAAGFIWNITKEFIRDDVLSDDVKKIILWLTRIKHYIYKRSNDIYLKAIQHKNGIEWYKIHDPKSRIEQYRKFNSKYGIPTKLHYFDLRGEKVSDWPENDKITPMMQFRFLPSEAFKFMNEIERYETQIGDEDLLEALKSTIVDFKAHKRIYGKAHIKTYDWIKKEKTEEQKTSTEHPCWIGCDLKAGPPAESVEVAEPVRPVRRSARNSQDMQDFFDSL
jgi:hypothetical protein